MTQAIKEGRRVVRARYGVDPDTCTGDHSCIRISGCPSLTITDNPEGVRCWASQNYMMEGDE